MKKIRFFKHHLKKCISALSLTTLAIGTSLSSNAQISYTQGWDAAGLASWTSTVFSRVTNIPCVGSGVLKGSSSLSTVVDVISPALTGTNGGPLTVSFKYKAMNYNSTTIAAGTSNVNLVGLEWGTSNAGPWNSMVTINGSKHTVSTSCSTVVAAANVVPSSGNIFLRFSVMSGGSADFYIDDVNVSQEPPPTCPTPTAPSLVSVTTSTATISWTAPSPAPADGYEYYYSTSNVEPFYGAAASGSVGAGVTTATINSLNPATQYYAWVRSSCGTNDKSFWTSVVPFTTSCPIATVPYVMNFDNITVPALPTCTRVENLGTGNLWVTNSTTGSGFSGKFLRYAQKTNNAANTWFYTEGVQLTAGATYVIAYDYGNSTSTKAEKMKVAYGTSNVAASMTTILANHSNINQATKQHNEVTFTPASSGVYYFGFHAYSDANKNYLYLDNIEIDEQPSCFAPGATTISNLTASSATINWVAPTPASANGYEYYYSTSSTAPTASATPSGTTAAGVTTANISSLTDNTNYYVWVRGVCSATEKSDWNIVKTFVTPPACGSMFYDNGGPTSPYGHNENITTVIGPDNPGDVVTVAFSVFHVESGYDFLKVYDGPNTSSPALHTGNGFSGTNIPGPFTSTHPSGTLTFVFTSDASTAGNGWVASVTCAPPCTPPIVTLGNDTTICAGGNLTLDAGTQATGATFAWSTGATTQTIAVTTAGTYSVTVTNGNCVTTDEIVVGVTPLPVVSLGNDTAICAGSTLTLNTGTQATGATFIWSSAHTTQTIDVTTAGTYSVEVTNGNCTTSDTIVVTVTALPVVALGNDTAICAGSTLTLNAGTQATGATIAWSTGATTQTINVTTAGTYTATVTNGNCVVSDAIVVGVTALPIVALGNDTTICSGSTLTLNAGTQATGATIAWSNGAATQTINVTTAGTYTATVTNGNCVVSDAIVVGVTALPVVALGNDTTICSGSTLTLNAGMQATGATIAWSNGATTQTIDATTADTYITTVTNGNCVTADTIVVDVAALPIVALGNDTSICEGTTLTLDVTGSANDIYSWSDLSGNPTLNVDTAGTYYVTVTNEYNCSASDTIEIGIDPLPSADSIAVTGTSPSFTFEVVGGSDIDSYEWNFGNGNTSTQENPTHIYTEADVQQEFEVSVIITNDCGSDTLYTTVIVAAGTNIKGLQLSADALKLYPNPATHSVTLKNESNYKMKQVIITNVLGQQVMAIPVNNNTQTIDVSILNSGLYNVSIMFEEGIANRKLEILK